MLTFEEFVEIRIKKTHGWKKDKLKKAIDFIFEIYDENGIKAFYSQNGLNEQSEKLYFLFGNGLLTVSGLENGEEPVYVYNSSNLTKKELITSTYKHQAHVLKFVLEDGTEFVFDNIKDADSEWASEYAESIIQFFKAL